MRAASLRSCPARRSTYPWGRRFSTETRATRTSRSSASPCRPGRETRRRRTSKGNGRPRSDRAASCRVLSAPWNGLSGRSQRREAHEAEVALLRRPDRRERVRLHVLEVGPESLAPLDAAVANREQRAVL